MDVQKNLGGRLPPKVSVVLPTYNRGYIISRAIESILAQTFQDFELIIVDDGSSDNTERVVRTFTDPRIRYIKELHRGGAAARNTGIFIAQGEFIAFQDSDDEWLPEKLARQVEAFRTAGPEIGVVYTGFWKNTKEGTRIYYPPASVRQKEGNIYEELLHGNFVTNQAAMVRRECFHQIGGYDESLPGMHELDLWLRMAKRYEFSYIPKGLVVTHFTEDSITAHHEYRLRGREIIFSKHFSDFEKYPAVLAAEAFVIGNTKALRGDMEGARSYLAIAWRTKPANLKYLAALALSLTRSKSFYRKIGKYGGRAL